MPFACRDLTIPNLDILWMANIWGDTNGDHAKYIKEAVEANPDTKWQIVTMHMAPFSAGHHSEDSDGELLTGRITPEIDEDEGA